MVKISVIIPIHNNEKYLNECLTSVFNQTLEDIEIICINDGSTDNSLKILNEYDNDDRIIILNQPNQGSAIARNNGLDIACGEYIGFLDADDIYINSKSLEMMYKAAEKYGADMISANLSFLTQKREIIPNPHYDKGTFYYFNRECEILPDEYGIPFYFSKNIFKADLIKNIRFPNLQRGEDPIYLSNILTKIDKIYGIPIDFYGYMVPTSFDKLDTYTKKYHYICQYKQCFDLLNKSKLYKTSDKYVHNLMVYLDGNIDVEVYDIICDVFGSDMDYFKNYKEEYSAFKKDNILNKILVENTQEYYLKAKKELNLKEDSLTEYKKELFKSKFNESEDEYIRLSYKNDILKEELESEKSFNEKITNSTLWKLMNRLRKIRG